MQTPLHSLHTELGGKMVEFAGYSLPVFYAGAGILAEHRQTRARASLFDVSHMGQVVIAAGGCDALSALVPAALSAVAPGRAKYTLLTNANGGVIDDCIVSNDGERGWFVVLNASRKETDIAHIRAALPDASLLVEYAERGLLAVQGPAAALAVGALFPPAAELKFMSAVWCDFGGEECRIARCGYTGEDGFEISVPAAVAEKLAKTLLDNPAVALAGLGARDSLRLEAGLCLYGDELDEETSPIEAGLLWTISKSRRVDGGYPGAAIIERHINEGAPRRLIGLLPEGRAPVRRGASLSAGGETVGRVTSGVYSPTLDAPIALAYVRAESGDGVLSADVRGKAIACQQTRPPFVPHNYVR